jgi:hypothetical protein
MMPAVTRTYKALPPRIVLRVAPRLLGDVLALALRDQGLDVVLDLDEDAPAVHIAGEHFDLAVVSHGLEGEVLADTVLVLDSSGTALAVAREEQDRRLGGDELASLIEAILDLVGGDVARG